jgi:hypothetical protein
VGCSLAIAKAAKVKAVETKNCLTVHLPSFTNFGEGFSLFATNSTFTGSTENR